MRASPDGGCRPVGGHAPAVLALVAASLWAAATSARRSKPPTVRELCVGSLSSAMAPGITLADDAATMGESGHAGARKAGQDRGIAVSLSPTPWPRQAGTEPDGLAALAAPTPTAVDIARLCSLPWANASRGDACEEDFRILTERFSDRFAPSAWPQLVVPGSALAAQSTTAHASGRRGMPGLPMSVRAVVGDTHALAWPGGMGGGG